MLLLSTATRRTFDGFAQWQIGLWYILSAVSTLIFLYGCWRLIRKYRAGRANGTPPQVLRSLKQVLTNSAILRRSTWSGIAHLGVFYGFIVLFAGTVILAFDDHVAVPLGFGFWHGPFYLGYSLFLDVFGAALLLGLCFFLLRRLARLRRLDYARVDGKPVSAKRARYRLDDLVFTWSLVVIGATGFVIEALRIVEYKPSFEVWAPVGYALARVLESTGLTANTASSIHFSLWWFHGLLALAFVSAIPFTKAMHMLVAPAALVERDPTVSKTLPSEPEAGYATLTDFTVAHLVDLDACTKCGKCHEVCPATNSGMPLSPRDLILDLREAAASGLKEGLVPGVVEEATLWSCMQCNACVDICPVGVQHVPIINLLRRNAIEEGSADSMLQATLEKIHTTGNSFGEQKRKRPRWVKDAGLEIPDARKQPVEILWYVGDYASFDPANQKNTIRLAQMLTAAGVDFGILYDAERTAGNDVRRAGEEGLFQMLAEENIETISGCEFERILTTDPHTFNTLRNEYPTLGAPWTSEQVVHHTELLNELLDAGVLGVTNLLSVVGTYHDPCALGRYNGIFEQPRDLIRRCGVTLNEMPRNRDNSLCCGAGGGRIWMKETAEPGSRRPAEQRIDEAVEVAGVEIFMVACPKDAVMYTDAIKTSGHADVIELRELTELVFEACGFNSATVDPVAAFDPAATDA